MYNNDLDSFVTVLPLEDAPRQMCSWVVRKWGVHRRRRVRILFAHRRRVRGCRPSTWKNHLSKLLPSDFELLLPVWCFFCPVRASGAYVSCDDLQKPYVPYRIICDHCVYTSFRVCVVAVPSDLTGGREFGPRHTAPQLTCGGDHRQMPCSKKCSKSTKDNCA